MTPFFVVFRSKGGKMIKVKDGKLQAELLDNKGTLSNKIIEQYDYIELKNDSHLVILNKFLFLYQLIDF